MGKCSKCGNKILYNAFKKIKGVIYCLKCESEERISKKLADTVSSAKLDFDEFQGAMKEVALVVVNEEADKVNKRLAKELGEPIKMTIEKPKKKPGDWTKTIKKKPRKKSRKA